MSRMEDEFDRQLANLVALGYPAICGLLEDAFTSTLEPLRPKVAALPDAEVPGKDRAPFAIVIPPELAPAERTFPLTNLNGKQGFIDLHPHEPGDFQPIEPNAVPGGAAYLAVGIETGAEYLNVTPAEALIAIRARGRSPLTLEEGIAAVTHFPGLLRKNACFSVPGSRGDDKRVPAIWISGGRPRLGWCWNGNPHTWLGSASCAARLGAN